MKKIYYLLFAAMLMFAFSACGGGSSGQHNNTGSSENTPASTAAHFLHYTLPDQYNYLANNPGKNIADEPADLFSAYTLTTGIDYGSGVIVSGYALTQFIDKAAVNAATPDPDSVLGSNDARELYAYVARSNKDGFSNRTKFYDNGPKTETYNSDLRWDQFNQGYLLDLNYDGKTFFPQTLLDPVNGGFMKMFNTQYAYDLYLFRKIDVKRPDAAGSLATFEVSATTDNYVDDKNFMDSTGLSTTKFTVETKSLGTYLDAKVISLTQFLTDYVTDTPASYTYDIVGLGGTSREGWTYGDMQQAYYLVDYDLIIRVDADNNLLSDTKIHYPVRIELISGTAVEYDYSAKNPPAYAKAYEEK